MKFLGFVVIFAIFASTIALPTKEFDVEHTESDEENGFRELWEKVKAAAKAIGPKIKEDAEKVLKSYKPKILDALKKIGRVVIEAGKEWVIEVRDGVVKIIAEGQEGSSPNTAVVDSNSNSAAGEKIKEIWGKVKAAFQNLGLKIAAAFKTVAEKLSEFGEKIKKGTEKIRARIAELAEKYGQKIVEHLNEVIDKYKDIIIDALKKDGKVIIDEGQTIVIEVVNDVVKIIVDGIHALEGKYEVATNEEEAENDLQEIWQKIVTEVMGYLQKYKEVIDKMMKKYRPQLIEEWKKIKKLLIDTTKDLAVDFLSEVMKCILGACYSVENGWSDIWERIRATVHKIKGHMSATTMKILEKYKPKIIDAVQHLESVVISCGKDLVIQIKDGIIKIITDGAVTMSDDSIAAADFFFEDNNYVQLIFPAEEKNAAVYVGHIDEAENGVIMDIIWAKVQEAGRALGLKIKADVITILNEYKPKIIAALAGFGKLVIKAGEDWVIEVKKGIIKIITEEGKEGEVQVPPANSPAGEKIKEIWGKVKAAFQNLGKKIADFFKKLGEQMGGLGEKIKEKTAGIRAKIAEIAGKWGTKVMAVVDSIVEKYKDMIIESLKSGTKVIIVEGRKIIIEVVNDVVKVVVDIMHALGGGKTELSAYSDENGIKELWEKVVAAVKAYAGNLKADVERMVQKYKPRIIEQLKKFKKVVIDEGKQLLIDMLGDAIKIIIRGGLPYEVQENDFKSGWEKVQEAFRKLGEKIKAKSEEVWKKLGPVFTPILEKYKDMIIQALQSEGTIIINEGRKIIITVINDVVKIIIDGMEAASGHIGSENQQVANSPAGEKLKEIWGKVKAAFQNLGKKIAEFFKKIGEQMAGLGEKIKGKTAGLREKIAEIAGKWGTKILEVIDSIVEKYKDMIIDALKTGSKVIIREGRTIIIEVVSDVVKVIVDGIHALGGKTELSAYNDENGIKELWEKVVAAVKAYAGNLKADVERMVQKYKPRIIEQLKKFKKVVIDEGKQLLIDMLGDAIKIIIRGGLPYEVQENDFKSGWKKVQEAFKKLGEQIEAKAEEVWKKIVPVAGPILEKYKDMIIEALRSEGTIIINEGRKIIITVINDVVKIIIDGMEAVSGHVGLENQQVANSPAGEKIKEIWGKVKAAFQNLGKKIAEFFKKLGEQMAGLGEKIKEKTAGIRAKIAEIAGKWGAKVMAVVDSIVEKYKDMIIESLKSGTKVIIVEGRKIVIEVVNDVVKVVVDIMHALGGKTELSAYNDENGIKELWEKVVAAVKAYAGNLKADVERMVQKYKPRIIEQLKKFKKVVIDEGKQLLIDMLGDAIKIIIRGGLPYEVQENDFKSGWKKVQEAFKKLGEQIEAKAEEVWKKIVPVAGPILEKYKDMIIEALRSEGTIIINEGRKIIITVINDVVKIIIDGMEAVSGHHGLEENDENGFKELWEKVKAAVEAQASHAKKEITTLVEKYKPRILEELKKFKKVVIEEGKGLVIEMLGDAIKIIIKGGIENNEEENGFKDLWEKVKAAVEAQASHAKKEITTLVEKYKPRILEELKKFKKVVIEEGKGLVIEMLGDAIKIIIKGGIENNEEENGFKDLWEKVKAAVEAQASHAKKEIMTLVEKYKPRILEELKKFKKVAIEEGKGLVIEMLGDAIKIIIKGGIENDEEENGLTDLWDKVKAAVKKQAGRYTKEMEALIEKYKPRIIDHLHHVKKVVIEEGKTLIIEVLGDAIKVIIKSGVGNEIEEDNGFKDIWARVKRAAAKVPGVFKEATDKIIEKYKDQIKEALQKVGSIVVEAGHKIAIKVVNDVIEIFVDGHKVAEEPKTF